MSIFNGTYSLLIVIINSIVRKLLLAVSELDLVELGVVSDELFEVVDDEAVFGEGREVVGEEAGEAAAAAGGGGLLGAGVGLAVGAGALVEEGRVDLGSDEVMGGAEVECGER